MRYAQLAILVVGNEVLERRRGGGEKARAAMIVAVT
jgi:hypothetical protein